MKQNARTNLTIGGVVGLIVFSLVLGLNAKHITLTPWHTTDTWELSTHASTNGERIAVNGNSEQTVVVLNEKNELIYRLDAKSRNAKSFTKVKYAELDEYNNLYIGDADYNGVGETNIERVVKYSPNGVFLEELWISEYTNENFILTKGKLDGLAYYDGYVYVVTLDSNSFELLRIPARQRGAAEQVQVFDYPDALRNLQYFNINPKQEKLVVSTKTGTIKQYAFSGKLTAEYPAEEGMLPYTVITDDNNNIVYTDVLTGGIVFINTNTNIRSTLLQPKVAYWYLSYSSGTLFAADADILVQRADGEFESIESYRYSSRDIVLRAFLFVLAILDVLLFCVLLVLLTKVIHKKRMSESLRLIVTVGSCIIIGAVIASVLIINEMNARYNKNAYSDLENISRLMAFAIDIDVLQNISSPVQFESPEYVRESKKIKGYFSDLSLKGKTIYQYIWMERDGIIYSMYDSESALGTLFPWASYGSVYQKVTENRTYEYTSTTNGTGSWIFAIGPIFDQAGNVVALIETGLNMHIQQEETRQMIIQTLLIVTSAVVAIFLIVLEFILIANAYAPTKRSKLLQKAPVFRPELFRAVVFFQLFSANLATAILPLYASRLYQPLFHLSKEFLVTLPFTANTIFVIMAQLALPFIAEKVGIKCLALMAGILFFVGNSLCFLAPNIVVLAFGYACIGFAGGTLVMVINSIISAQKTTEEVRNGFAHYNASILSGLNVGIILGSIIAQFFPYRVIFLFAALFSMVLLGIILFSIRSSVVNYLYDVAYTREKTLSAKKAEDKFALLRFISTPVVLCTLFLLYLPYTISSFFVDYFLPIFASDNGVKETNIGQLMLLSGLFAILFGTSLCEYVAKKLPVKFIIVASLALIAFAFSLFGLDASVPMLIIAVLILAVVNIFASTNIETYYAGLYMLANIPSMKALSVFSMVGNASGAIGPLIFSFLLAQEGGVGFGMRLCGLGLGGFILLFLLISVFDEKRMKKHARSDLLQQSYRLPNT